MDTGMTPVEQILATKGRSVWSIAPNASVRDALALMSEKNIGALVVLDGNRLAGIVSERDYARRVALKGKSSGSTQVHEIMTEAVSFVIPKHTVADCMSLMTIKHIRHLPVIQDDRVIGLISIGDVVKALLAEQEFMLEQMEHYINGTR